MDQVAQIREKIDIVSFISEFIPLKKAGRNFSANCPFHNEKTPSFMVSPERQRWHCFGCGKSGDCYAFLMEYERMEFPEALRMLAKRTGIELTTQQGSGNLTSKKELLYQINGIAKEYYHYLLTKHNAGKKALEYLSNRGITEKLIDTFFLGFAPPGNDNLVQYLLKKKHIPKEDILDAGLAFQQSGGRIADFFRGRLIFPLFDHRNNVVGFSGRVLDPEIKVSKYINTRETLVYHKGDHLYGLNVTKDAIRRENQVVIVEGEFDVLSCFQNGIGNVVGVKGTALTDHQVNLLSRFTQKITFCFDGDKAGQEAIKRSLAVVEKKGLTPTVIEIPGGKDPDESLRKEPGLFRKAVKEDIGIYDYLLNKAFTDTDSQTAEGKKQIADLLLPILAQITNEIVKEHYLRKLSTELDTSYESIVRELQRLKSADSVQVPKPPAKIKKTKEEMLEEYLLSLILQSNQPQKLFGEVISQLAQVMTKERAYQKIMHQLFEHLNHVEQFDRQVFGNSLAQELIHSYDLCLLTPVPEFESDEKLHDEVEKTARKLQIIYIQQRMKKLAEEIKEKEKNGQEVDVTHLQKNYSQLAARLTNVQ